MKKVKTTYKKIVTGALITGAMLGIALVAQPAQAETLQCSVLDQSICNTANEQGSRSGIFGLLIWVLNIMTAVVGVAAVGGIIWGGILYATAGEKTDQVKKAKTVIIDVVIGIIAYGLMYVALNWLVPGGVFKQ